MTKIVYILTNQSMPDTIKIGITDNLERRIKELEQLQKAKSTLMFFLTLSTLFPHFFLTNVFYSDKKKGQ